jgi:hypothetical protein
VGANLRRSVTALRPEPPLTPLGLTPAELAQALGRYHLRVRALIQALGSAAPASLHHEGFAELEDLGAVIDVDLGSRAAPRGAMRMSEVERTVLLPLLGRLRDRLALLTRNLPSRDWLALLKAADDDIAAAERAIDSH